jgi:hypothetical protein
MSEVCQCGCDEWSFCYCEIVECDGHWTCDRCGVKWDEQVEL